MAKQIAEVSDVDIVLSARRWRFVAERVAKNGKDLSLSADRAELSRLAEALDLVSVASFQVNGRIEPTTKGRFVLRLKLHAEIKQTCVVTLEPVAAVVEESASIIFWPVDRLPTPP